MSFPRHAISGAISASLAFLNAVSHLTPSRYYAIRYGHHVRHGIDVYEPRKIAPFAPTIVFFYGGGWTAGSRCDYRFIGTALAQHGFRVCIPDYRLHPEASLAEIEQDGRDALKSIAMGYSLGDMFLMGHSAGAHIALRLASTSGSGTISGVMALAAPMIAGVPSVKTALPPALFLAARNDRIVSAENSRKLASGWGRSALQIFDKGGHALLVGALSPVLSWYLPITGLVAEFVNKHVKNTDIRPPERL